MATPVRRNSGSTAKLLMCNSSATRHTEQKPTDRPSSVLARKTERYAVVLELRQIHLTRPRVREGGLLDDKEVVHLFRARDGLNQHLSSVCLTVNLVHA
mgnify:CR=1 FL=1